MTIANPQPKAAATTETTTPPETDAPPAKTFTQEELDAIVRERLARVEAEAKAKLEEAEKKAEKANTGTAATVPPATVETPSASTGSIDAEALKAEATEAAKAALYPMLAAEKAKAAAAQLGFVNAEDATKMLDISGLIVDGAISDEKIKEAVTALAKERPYLLASQTAKASEVGIGAYGTDSAEPVLTGADLMAQVLNK